MNRFVPLLALLATTSQAQVFHFPMEVTDNLVSERITGQQYAVQGQRSAVSTVGALGKALRTDGYSTYVEAPIDASLLNGDAFTFSMWLAAETYPMMNIDEDRNDYTTIAGTLDHNTHTGFALQLTNRGNWRFECYAAAGSEFSLEAPQLLPKRQWCHLAATVDATARQLTLYLNGELVAQTNMRRGLNLGTGPLLIGKSHEDVTRDGFLLNTFNGIIDDIALYDHVLTVSEIQTLANDADVKCGSAADVTCPADAFKEDLLRPRFHGMPSAGWTNETHGLTYSDGQWHLFFQKNGNGPYMSRLHWGHLSSSNLYDWSEQPIAIDPADSYDIKGCWSGCVAQDEEVFGTTDPAIIYTGVDYVKASIDFAVPTDASLLEWQKAGNNPRIASRPSGLSDDFRDPYFFRTDQGAYLIVGSSKGGVGCCTLHKYNAANGTWSNDGDIFFQGTSAQSCGTFWEMPNVTRIDQERWLFTVTPQNIGNVGVRTLYWVGTIGSDGKFTPSSKQAWPLTVEMSGMSSDGYGMLSPSIFAPNASLNPEQESILALGIVPDKVSTSNNYKWGWAHCYSLPREWSLTEDDRLLQRPFAGLQSMRLTDSGYQHQDFVLNGSEILGSITGRQLEVLATFEVGTSDFGFRLLQKDDKALLINYAPATGTITVDATNLQRVVNDGGSFKGIYRHTLNQRPATGSDFTLHVFFDGSVLDLFVNEEQAASIRIFPTDAEAVGTSIFSSGATHVRSVQAWMLDSKHSESAIETVHSDTPTLHSEVRFFIDPVTQQLTLHQLLANGDSIRWF